MKLRTIFVLVLFAAAALSRAQAPAQAPVQTDDDEYTRYELLAPETQSFRIYYDVTATTPGAQYYFNGLRKGSEHTIHGVLDLMTGAPLEWKVVKGDVARERGLPRAALDEEFLQVKLARPVPAGGEARIRIDKTYKDAASYFREGDKIVFARPLGIKRNSVVLPEGYELVGCNYPSQIRTEADGRLRVSFMNPGPGTINYRVEARVLSAKKSEAKAVTPAQPTKASAAMESREVSTAARVNFTFSERAFQDREIVYFLQQPETHAFRLYHDYTETREGVDRYLNVVRGGSSSSNPSAKILDTGEALKVETIKGAKAAKRGIKIDEPVTPETEIVVIWFPAVKKGQSLRLRIEETYTDANRYVLYGDELVWDRSFGRPRNTVVLPEGWYVTANSIPATVSLAADGRVQL
ncbi:MAG TPA: hypothetical protein VGQ11_01920, partial [Candidatus Acidoferrales bacterium]|nr:hypothetical protein [Candidatus Acidoferrales bacterium]